MRKTKIALLAFAAAAVLAACSSNAVSESNTVAVTEETAVSEEIYETENIYEAEDIYDTEDASEEAYAETLNTASDVTLRVGSLKGPTSIGLLWLINQAGEGLTQNNYEFTMAVAADELSAGIVGGTLDIALLPANVASIVYNRTNGGVTVIDINTLGVLDVVTADKSITSFADLSGKTIYITGKGTTPDYAFSYLLSQNGISEDEVDLEYKSEPAEVAALLAKEPGSIGVLPQPFVTAACAQNEDLAIVLDLTEEWDKVQGDGGSRLVTGVTIVRNEVLDEYPEEVINFVEDHYSSAAYTYEYPDETAELVAESGIIEQAAVAKKALPYCNITCITGDDMHAALEGYLTVLAGQDITSIGGTLPGEDFYRTY